MEVEPKPKPKLGFTPEPLLLPLPLPVPLSLLGEAVGAVPKLNLDAPPTSELPDDIDPKVFFAVAPPKEGGPD